MTLTAFTQTKLEYQNGLTEAVAKYFALYYDLNPTKGFIDEETGSKIHVVEFSKNYVYNDVRKSVDTIMPTLREMLVSYSNWTIADNYIYIDYKVTTSNNYVKFSITKNFPNLLFIQTFSI